MVGAASFVVTTVMVLCVPDTGPSILKETTTESKHITFRWNVGCSEPRTDVRVGLNMWP